jgi:hypothetical protein
MGPVFWLFSCSVLRVTGSQLAVVTAAIAYTCLMSARASTLWQWVHLSWYGRREEALALLYSWP